MALSKTILRMTEMETVIKVFGAGGTTTIDLATDLVDVNQAFEGMTAAEIETAKDSYEGQLAVVQDILSQQTSAPGYPWGLTLPASHITIDQLQRLKQGVYTGSLSLIPASQTLKNAYTFYKDAMLTKVTITGVRWTGALGNTITVTRNSVPILTLPTDEADYIAFDGQELPPENTESASNIVVSQTGTGQIELYLKLRKVSGYSPRVETAQFGSYDNTEAVRS